MIEIKQVGIDDVSIVNNLAYQIWPNTFHEILTSNQINYMLDWMYDVNKLKEEIQTGYLYYVVKYNSVSVGFMSLEVNFPDLGFLRIHKIYLKKEFQGKGIGRALINHAIDICFDLDLISLHLNVNRFNKAVEFYKHIGFKIIGQEDVDIGKGYLMEDYIMELKLKN